jgi:hypothetical protein
MTICQIFFHKQLGASALTLQNQKGRLIGQMIEEVT